MISPNQAHAKGAILPSLMYACIYAGSLYRLGEGSEVAPTEITEVIEL